MWKEAICHEQDEVVLMHSSAVYDIFCFHWTMHKNLLQLSESEHTSVSCPFYHFTFPLFPIKSHASRDKAMAQKSKQGSAYPSNKAEVVHVLSCSLWVHILYIWPEKSSFPLKYIGYTGAVIISLSLPVV